MTGAFLWLESSFAVQKSEAKKLSGLNIFLFSDGFFHFFNLQKRWLSEQHIVIRKLWWSLYVIFISWKENRLRDQEAWRDFLPSDDVIFPFRKTPTTSLFAFNVLRSFAFSEPIIFLSFVMIVWIQVSLFCFEVADLQRLSDCCRGFDMNVVWEAWSIYC